MDETATVVAEVRSITSRPVRRRGMKPLVEAVVADATGTMKATFFNQPWLERKYRPGTRLLLQGKYQGRNRFRVSFHAPTGEAVGAAEEMATYPATDGLSSTQILALAPPVARRRAGGARAAAGAAARARAPARPRRGARRRPLRRPRGRPPPARVRGADAAPDRAAAPPRAPPRGRARRGARAAGRADRAAGCADSLPFTPTDDQRARDGDRRRRPRARPPDAAAADGGGRLGQDRRRALRDAARGRAAAPRRR